MKIKTVLFCIILAFESVHCIKTEAQSSRTRIDDVSFLISPDPVNNYLDVKIDVNRNAITGTPKEEFSAYFQIINPRGALVYTATKHVGKFSIFTGGLPEGEYRISCRVDTMLLQRNFAVKH
jgi:hypothetical protein